MRTLALVVLLVVVVMTMAGCPSSSGDPAKVGATTIRIPVDYGNSVYYFPCTDAAFDNSLAAFLKANPNLEVSGISGDGTSAYGSNSGYHVTFREKHPLPAELDTPR